MNRLSGRTFVLLIAALAAAAPALRAEVKPEMWRYVAPVTVKAPPAEGKGLVEVSLSPEVLDRASRSLSDIRITDAAGTEVPYVLHRTRAERPPLAKIRPRLINRSYLPGRSSSVTADFERKFLKDRIHVDTLGLNFRRPVLVESSDDGTNWQRIREGALLFRIGRDSRVEFERDAVTFPQNDHRYLRITVFNGDDDVGRVEIKAVQVSSVVESRLKPARTVPVDILETSVSHEDKKTLIEFDLGYRHLPLRRLVLTFDDRNFFREARLEGRDEKTRIVRTPREDDKMAERTVEVPWRRVASAILFRYTAGGNEDSSLSIPLDGAGCRYLRLTIENRDNPPLAFRGAELDRFLQLVRFPFEPGEARRLYAGNARAAAPSYDLPHYVSRLAREGVVQAELGQMAANPAYTGVEERLPWSERHPVILWAALIAVGLVLAALILRQVRSIRTGQEHSGPS